jgi:3-hydroxybutyryl-CoA dehydrogenase
MANINDIGVVGAGQMGSGIALVAARSGYEVVMHDLTVERLQWGMESISHFIDKGVAKGSMKAADKSAIVERIQTSIDLHSLQHVDFVIEAATENEAVKFEIFRELDRICPPQTVLSSNTSSIPIGRIAAQTHRSDRVIGMHFMNPPPMMKLVEVIRSLATSEDTFHKTCTLAESFGNVTAEARDFPGFISNRILMTMINEAIFTLYQGIGTRDAIDTVMESGMNHPMGPLALADLIGLDTCLAVMETLYDGYRDPHYSPCPLLRQYVDAGWLGRKTGQGFYTYSAPSPEQG